MSREEHKRRRVMKHAATIICFVFRCVAFLAFCIGVFGGAGYIQQGGDIARGLTVVFVSLFLSVAVGLAAGALDGDRE